MPLTSAIVPYDPIWAERFEDERERLEPIFGAHLVSIDHVGSTAVPGLAAKPEIDVLVVLDEPQLLSELVGQLEGLGYARGGDLSPGHAFFKKDVGGIRTHKLHVCVPAHREVARMVGFRDLLRSNSDVRTKYQTRKLELERENTTGIAEYLRGKAPFIDDLIRAHLGIDPNG